MVKEVATLEEFNALKAKPEPLFVDFYADWCGPCRAIAPFYLELAEQNPDITFIKVNVDKAAIIAQDCGIQCMPTFHIYKNGKKIDSLEGANKEKLAELVAKCK